MRFYAEKEAHTEALLNSVLNVTYLPQQSVSLFCCNPRRHDTTGENFKFKNHLSNRFLLFLTETTKQNKQKNPLVTKTKELAATADSQTDKAQSPNFEGV